MGSSTLMGVIAERVSRKPSAHKGRVGATYEGYLVAPPQVGWQLVIIRPGGTRMMTSPIVRILQDPDSGSMFVETRNSVYRVRAGIPVTRSHTPSSSRSVG